MPIDLNPINQYDAMAEMPDTHLQLPFQEALLAAHEINRQNELGRQQAEQLDVLGKSFRALDWHKPELAQRRQEIYNTIDSLQNPVNRDFRSREYNDRLYKAKRDLQNELNYGKLAAGQQAYDQFTTAEKQILEDKNPMKASYRRNQLYNLNKGKSLEFDPQTGQWRQTEIPIDWEWKDLQDETSKWLKDINSDSFAKEIGWGGTPIEFTKMFREGKLDQLTKEKIKNSLYKRVAGDPNLLKSIEAEAFHFNRDPHQIIDNIVEGVASGAAYRKEDLNYQFIDDKLELHNAKKASDAQQSISTNILQTNPELVQDPSTVLPSWMTNSVDPSGKLAVVQSKDAVDNSRRVDRATETRWLELHPDQTSEDYRRLLRAEVQSGIEDKEISKIRQEEFKKTGAARYKEAIDKLGKFVNDHPGIASDLGVNNSNDLAKITLKDPNIQQEVFKRVKQLLLSDNAKSNILIEVPNQFANYEKTRILGAKDQPKDYNQYKFTLGTQDQPIPFKNLLDKLEDQGADFDGDIEKLEKAINDGSIEGYTPLAKNTIYSTKVVIKDVDGKTHSIYLEDNNLTKQRYMNNTINTLFEGNKKGFEHKSGEGSKIVRDLKGNYFASRTSIVQTPQGPQRQTRVYQVIPTKGGQFIPVPNDPGMDETTALRHFTTDYYLNHSGEAALRQTVTPKKQFESEDYTE